ncbi:MAG: hypothetical protein H0T14_01305 [Nocardioidaceae bacterium]|nr:hypothetical protein [Nocardioidaceae bacterium]
MRPMLRPGLQILRRDMFTLQLGLDWPGLAVVEETPVVRAVLDAIDGYRDVAGVVLCAMDAAGLPRSDCEAALALLVECGAVVAQTATSSAVSEPAWTALSLLAGPDHTAADLLRERADCSVYVDGVGQVASQVHAALALAKLKLSQTAAGAGLVVMATDSEPARSRVDDLMHLGVPHLWVCLRDLVGVLGPFVIPGHTACLRCVDAARTDRDPAWPALLDAAAARPLPVTASDPVLCALVASWAVLEAQTWAAGLHPQTSDRVIEVPYGCGAVQTEEFDLHPHCGCGWPTWQDTMGA